jgi:hypothetical protein
MQRGQAERGGGKGERIQDGHRPTAEGREEPGASQGSDQAQRLAHRL